MTSSYFFHILKNSLLRYQASLTFINSIKCGITALEQSEIMILEFPEVMTSLYDVINKIYEHFKKVPTPIFNLSIMLPTLRTIFFEYIPPGGVYTGL